MGYVDTNGLSHGPAQLLDDGTVVKTNLGSGSVYCNGQYLGEVGPVVLSDDISDIVAKSRPTLMPIPHSKQSN